LFRSGLPLDVGIIYDENNVFQKDFDYALGNPFQDEFIESEGSLTQISLAYGGNLKNKLFLGGSVGITSVNFLSTKTFNEEFRDDENVNSLYYSLQENLLQKIGRASCRERVLAALDERRGRVRLWCSS